MMRIAEALDWRPPTAFSFPLAEHLARDCIGENCASPLHKERNLTYDSRVDTLRHSQRVGELIGQILFELIARSHCHDHSKTESPEVGVFDEFTPRLSEVPYGTPEYAKFLERMGDALQHHYRTNRYHPEHYTDGIDGMTLIDIVEMLCDWKAATERTKNGDLSRSLEIQQGRFGISDQLYRILRNTAEELGWI